LALSGPGWPRACSVFLPAIGSDMQLPGLDELEGSVGRAVDELKRLKAENAELSDRLRALGKEIDELGTLVEGIGSGQKVDSKTKKRMGSRLKSMADKVG